MVLMTQRILTTYGHLRFRCIDAMNLVLMSLVVNAEENISHLCTERTRHGNVSAVRLPNKLHD